MPAKRTPRKKTAEPLDQQTYLGFIAQIELQDIWLKDIDCQGDTGVGLTARTEFDLDSGHSYENWDGGITILHRYALQVQASMGDALPFSLAEAQFEIEATFELEFTSAIPMTDELMLVFAAMNLPLHSWPYFRELVSSMMGRMGWQSYTLPMLKLGIDEAVAAVDDPPPAPAKRPGGGARRKPAAERGD